MKKNIKRIGAVLIAGTIVFAVAGCNKKEETVSKNATVEKTEKEEIVPETDFTSSQAYLDFVELEKEKNPNAKVFYNEDENTIYVEDTIFDLERLIAVETSEEEKKNDIETWNLMTEADCQLSELQKKSFFKEGYDVSVVRQLVSDSDVTKVLYSCMDGNPLYNCADHIVINQEPQQDNSDEPIEQEKPVEEYKPTMGEKNALKKANSYLSLMAFSYTGLIEQLEYEGYSTEEATYAVDNCGADWNEQAAKKAEDYLNTMSFSRTGLIEQLEYEGFTHEQAVYGVEAAGY